MNLYEIQVIDKNTQSKPVYDDLPKSFELQSESVVTITTIIAKYGVPSGGDSHDVRRTFENKGYEVVSVTRIGKA